MATKATKLPSGNWRVRAQRIDPDGSRHYKSFTDPSRTKAIFMAAQYEDTGKLKGDPSNITVGDAIDNYIDDRNAVLSPATVREYRRMRRNYLQTIMPIKLRQLTFAQVQRAVNLDTARVSPKTVRNAYNLLTPALDAAIPDLDLKGINLPQRVNKEVVVPEEEAVQLLIHSVGNRPLCSAILLEAFGGLRRSEISALEASDLDITTGTISINKAVVLDEHGKWVYKSTKSYAGTRTVRVPAFVITEVLRRSKNRNGKLVGLLPDTITNQFCIARKKVGLTCRFHDLRHFTASIMLALGVPDKYAMEIMGHSTPNMLKRVYQHTMTRKREQVSEEIVSYFNRFSEKCDTKCDTSTDESIK